MRTTTTTMTTTTTTTTAALLALAAALGAIPPLAATAGASSTLTAAAFSFGIHHRPLARAPRRRPLPRNDGDVNRSTGGLWASLEMPFPEEPTATVTPSPDSAVGSALTMTIEELALQLGGTGRARLAWDCYAGGADPALLFGGTDCGAGDGDSAASPSNDSDSDDDLLNEYDDMDRMKRRVLPTPRRTQFLGSDALDRLADLHSSLTPSPAGGREGGEGARRNAAEAAREGRLEGRLVAPVQTSASSDGTHKLLLRLADGVEVETVLIPWYGPPGPGETHQRPGDVATKGGRTTVCVSSQVGCRQGCTFCATGRMGKVRSLTADEILAQLFYAVKLCRLKPDVLPKVTNVVFMGMGEPADNAPAVRKAVEIMTSRDHFHLSSHRVTVSTVAPSPDAFLSFQNSKCVLAWSVHAARDDLRKKLVPTTKHSMAELRGGLMDALRSRPAKLRTCMIEIALIDGVNDSQTEADELAAFVGVISDDVPRAKVFVNLIPFNDIFDGRGVYGKPSPERVMAFQKRLQERGVYAHVRGTRGDEESAACGQLATKSRKQQGGGGGGGSAKQ